MAMNKKELAEMDKLRRDVDLARALSWPSYSMPKAMTKAEIDDRAPGVGATPGWFWNKYEESVNLGCSNGYSHNSSGPKTSTQGMGRMMRTRLQALQALRIEVTVSCAERLARIDAMIKAEESALRGGDL